MTFLKFFICLTVLSNCLFASEKKQTVVCLHGFLGASWNMRFIEKNLNKDHWNAVSWEYPSRERYIEEHGKKLVPYLKELAKTKPGQPIHFVAHSMGSLVLLVALNHPECPREAKIGKVVLLAPPLKGSVWGRWLNQFSIAKHLAKEFSGHQLMTKSDFSDLGNYPDSLQDVLVIAGSFGFNPMISGQNDGTLAVQETVLPTPHRHVVIARGHKTIIFSKKAYVLIKSFLEEGKPQVKKFVFEKADPSMKQELINLAIHSNDIYQTRTASIDKARAVFDIPDSVFRKGVIEILKHNGKIVGFYTLKVHSPSEQEFEHELGHLFVMAGLQGQGYGTLLFNRAVEKARERGWKKLEWYSDPDAKDFYLKMGGIISAHCENLLNPGVDLPIFKYEL